MHGESPYTSHYHQCGWPYGSPTWPQRYGMIYAWLRGQLALVERWTKMIFVFVMGPAGYRQKTYTAVALAESPNQKNYTHAARLKQEVSVLPGDLRKIDHICRAHCYDALDDMIPAKKLSSVDGISCDWNSSTGIHERKDLRSCFIILGEAQNNSTTD